MSLQLKRKNVISGQVYIRDNSSRALTKEGKAGSPQGIHIGRAFGAGFEYISRRILKSFCSKLNLYLNSLASIISSYQVGFLSLCRQT